MADQAMKQNNYRPWKQGGCWLLLLAPLFFLSYGQVNQFTATREGVGSLVFHWESMVPFMPWTIIPYWSIDLLYGISLFICSSKQELTRHGCRLLMASLIACIGFLLFPLKFSFIRPETSGLFGWLFRQLEQFDLPYNQAPSLHIILTWLLWLRFRQHLSGYAAGVSGAWFLLIAVSVLTTWQHHFIDIISGIIVGILIGYAIPIKGKWHWHPPTLPALRLALKYLAGALLFLVAGLCIPFGYILLWPASALLMVAMGYAGLGVTIFQKNSQGYLTLSARLLLLPYLAGAWISKCYFSRKIDAWNEIMSGVALGRFPDNDVEQSAILDLTTEFHRAKGHQQAWLSYPLMDLLVPQIADLQYAVSKLSSLHQTHDKVLACCALGLSRSATVVAAWLLASGHAQSPAQAVILIRSLRPQVVLTAAHIQLLEKFNRELLCQNTQ